MSLEDAELEQYIGQITRAVQSSKEKVKTKVQQAVEAARSDINDMLKKKRREIASAAQKDVADAKKWVELEEQRLQELHESCVGLMKQAQAEMKKAEDSKESLQEQWEESNRKYKRKLAEMEEEHQAEWQDFQENAQQLVEETSAKARTLLADKSKGNLQHLLGMLQRELGEED
jgi:F0F1-type ATP synthase membrane subunit b/b'